MPDVIVEKETCSRCGVDVRTDTLFCYNCGTRVASEPRPATNEGKNGGASVESKAALDDLAKKLGEDETAGDKLARAAERRREARAVRRKSRKIVWVPTGDSSQGTVLLLSVAVTIITFVVVLLTVVWE
jgi:hypothetical protein